MPGRSPSDGPRLPEYGHQWGVVNPEDGGFELGTDGPSVILVGVDDSTTSIRAGWYAAGLARRQRARIVAVFVSPMASLGTAGPAGASLAVARDEAFRNSAEEFEMPLGLPPTIVYVANADSREIIVLGMRADGVLSPV